MRILSAFLYLGLCGVGKSFSPAPLRIAVGPPRVAPSLSVTRPSLVSPNVTPRRSLLLAEPSDDDAAADAAIAVASSDDSAGTSKAFELYMKTASTVTNLFPLWTVLCTVWALKSPQDFAWFTTEYFTGGLAMLMLSMGITLSPNDFVRVGKRPNAVVLQFLLCYVMMPVLALLLGWAFKLEPGLLAGMVLVGSINGGQASNLCTYIAKGNVALSVLMTTATTLGAIFMTPILCKGLLGTVVPVDAVGIAMSTIQVVLMPIIVGMTTNKFFPNFVKKILPITPLVGIFSTCLLVASAVAQVADPILSAGLKLQFPVMLLHLLGGLVGYVLPQMVGFGEVASRTMAIETSMKSSAFGFLLAKLHFGQFSARTPSAVSVVWMALTGSILAVIWRYIPVKVTGTFDRSLVEKYPPFSATRFFGRFKFWEKKTSKTA